MAISSVNKDFLVKNGLVVKTTATILSTTNSVSTTTGALVVSGGAGIGGALFVGGNVTAPQFIGNVTGQAGSLANSLTIGSGLSGTSSTFNGSVAVTVSLNTATLVQTASNLAGGTAGQVAYQTGAGQTGFFGPGTAGQILVSTGAAAPTYTNTGSIYVANSVNAEKWLTARTLSLTGDVTGSASIDGSGNVNLATTISADATALGTDTTGLYVATATGGTGIAVSGSGVETAAITITNLGVTSLTGGGGVTVSSSTGSVTLGFTTSTLVQTASNLAGGSQGQLAYQSAAGTTAFVNSGTSGQFLQASTNGAPTWTSTSSMYVHRATTADTAALLPNALTISTGLIGTNAVYDGSAATTISLNTATLMQTAVNLNGGSQGRIAYQTAAGVTGFINSGTTGQLLQATTNGAPVFTSTSSIFVNRSATADSLANALTISTGLTLNSGSTYDGSSAKTLTLNTATLMTTAVNLVGGSQGQLAYQSASGATAFATSGTTGQFLQATTNGAPVFTSTASMYVNRAVTADTAALLPNSLTFGTGLSGTSASYDGSTATTVNLNTATLMQTAVNLAGGSQGRIAYQSADGTTAFVSSGTTGQFLQATTNGAPAFTNTASMYVQDSVNAERWKTTRTISLTGDVTGTANIDGTGNIGITTTISADSVALGTDTTGNYVAAGATSGWGLSGSASSEGATFTVASNATSTNSPSTLVFRDANGDFSARSVTLTGDLVVQGTTFTVDSTVTNVSDPIFNIGNGPNGAAPLADDNKDRGIAFQWHNGSSAKIGFFGFDDSTGYLTFVPDATITNEVVSGSFGDIQATNFRGALVGNADSASKWTTPRTFTFDGDLSGSMVVDGSQNVTFTATIVADSVALGTDTTGAYIATATAGTGIAIAGSGAETAAITITNLGVTSLTASSGLVTDVTTGSVTITNVGVTSIAGTAPIALSASTGSVTVSLTTGSTYVANAVSAEKWLTARTFTFGGDLTGSMVVDGSQNVTFTATIAADSVALGTDTTGNYVAGISAGNAIGISGSGSESATVTVENLGVTALTGGGGITVSTSTGSITLGFTTSTLVQTASNLAGGDQGQIAYQSAPGTTAFASSGTTGQFLQATTNGAPAFTSTASMYVANSVNAEKWSTARTLSLTGDVTGSASIDGSGNVNLAATISADSVALGTDTTGVYVATATAGTGIGVAGSGAETAAITITNLGVTSVTAGTGIATDASTGSITLTNTGVTALTGGGGITVSSSTGSVTLGFTTSTLVQTASNLAGGSQGQIAYQSASGTTAFASSGTTGQFLQATTNGAPAFTSTGSMYVQDSVNAERWKTTRTISLTGDVTGTANIDGTGNIGIAATIAADSVALGTDTTGNYVASGATSGYGLSGSASAETSTFTVNSNATSTNAAGTIVFRNDAGSFDVGSIQIKDTTAATSTSTGALKVEGGVGIGGNLYIGGEIVAQKLTIQLTTVTTTLVETDDIINTANATNATSTTTGAIVAAGGLGLGKDLRVGGSAYISGNQTVTGTVTHSGLVTTAGTNIDQIKTTSTSLTLTTGWQYIGVSGTDLATGSYMVQITADDTAAGGGQVNMYYTGVMSWYSGATTENATNEIPLTRAGGAAGSGAVFLRTTATNAGVLSLELAGLTNNSTASTYNFSFRRMI